VARRVEVEHRFLGQGRRRGRIRSWADHEAHFLVDVDPLPESSLVSVEIEALMRSVQSTFETYVKLNNLLQRLFCRR
jgi:ATP-dependent Lon protease